MKLGSCKVKFHYRLVVERNQTEVVSGWRRIELFNEVFQEFDDDFYYFFSLHCLIYPERSQHRVLLYTAVLCKKENYSKVRIIINISSKKEKKSQLVKAKK